ncbi:kinesin-domain-containing protein [Aureobasidium subglaciale]|nr:kinesin-domain-containing protein [Aureobasidium subglaciale]
MAVGAIDGASSITVAVRVRPFTIREAAQLTRVDDGPLFLGDGNLAAAPVRLAGKGIRSVIKVMDEKCLIFDPEDSSTQGRLRPGMGGKRTKDQPFTFDRVFDENITQAEVYEATTKNLLDSVFDGYNATVFAYGATGCGKTHTITGTAQQPGIIFLTMQEMFERIVEMQEEKQTEVTLSYLEIYNETIRDLLIPIGEVTKKGQGLMLREDANQAVSVAGLTSHRPQNVNEVMDMLIRGNENRTQSPTEANATSSRSHAVLQINVAQKDRNAGHSEPTTFATLSIIDLAGSERASATKNRGERLLEGANINKSLLSLGSCINALCDPKKKNHVPYRNSKLTRLLKFSLGGNCRTVMIVCVSPSSVHFDETQNTLRYANRAKNIQTKAVRNVYNVDRHVKDYLKKIDEQMALIKDLQAQHKEFESLAFTKFKKVDDKRSALLKEALARIRAAYDHAADERKEHINNMKRLRQIERRIGMVSAWIGSFDQICENREDEEPQSSLVSMRKSATGVLAELEASRQHYHQRLAKASWERSLDTALQNGIRQMHEVDASTSMSSPAIASLKQEVEVLRSRAEREAQSAVLNQEKTGDTALVQVLLQAHFETIAILGQIMQMDEQEAVKAAKLVLTKLLNSCTEATSQVIKPDGSLAITQAVPPTRSGTPKKKKAINLAGPSPIKAKMRPSMNPPQFRQSPNLGPSPASPRRRKLGVPRKSVAFNGGGTPKKKSPVKTTKRGVRWRDDTEDGKLEEFQPTPPGIDSSLNEPSLPDLSQYALQSSDQSDNLDSSPIPPPPVPSSELRSRNSRFQAGFLKKEGGSPVMPALSSLANAASENLSPLREIEANSTFQPKRSPIPIRLQKSAEFASDDHIGSSASDNDDPTRSLQDSALQIQSAMRRRVSSGSNRHRRRSPAAQANGSPNSSNENNLFTASHARRMVKSEKSEATNVLSPRSAPVVKNAQSISNLRAVSRESNEEEEEEEEKEVSSTPESVLDMMMTSSVSISFSYYNLKSCFCSKSIQHMSIVCLFADFAMGEDGSASNIHQYSSAESMAKSQIQGKTIA